MIQGNYTAKAIAGLPDIRRGFVRNGWTYDLLGIDFLERIMRAAEPFLLPENGMLFDRDHERYYPSRFRLPYPVTALEFLMLAPDEPVEFLSPRRLTIAFHCSSAATTFQRAMTPEMIADGICLVVFSDLGRLLMPEWSVALLPKNVPGEITVVSWGDGPKRPMPVNFKALPLLTEYWDAKRVAVGMTRESAANHLIENCAYEAEVLLQMLCALECKNVRIDTLDPPSRLQQKRLRDKKVPLLSYKVLTIDTAPKAIRDQPLGGAHRSPRTHLRRGHIRRLNPDGSHNIWVNATIVRGQAKGLVLKDYAVS